MKNEDDPETKRLLIILACGMILGVAALVLFFLHNLPDAKADALADEIAESALIFAVITLFVVLMQFVLSYKELQAVREDLKNNNVLFKRQLRESELWPYGYIRFANSLFSPGGTEISREYHAALKVKNVGEVVDIRYSVIVGLHKSWGFVDSPGWIRLDWHPQSRNAKYREFRFFKHVSTDPIYVNDYVELPILRFQPAQFSNGDLSDAVIFSRVSTDYKANPDKPAHYLRILRAREQAQNASVDYIYESDEVAAKAFN